MRLQDKQCQENDFLKKYFINLLFPLIEPRTTESGYAYFMFQKFSNLWVYIELGEDEDWQLMAALKECDKFTFQVKQFQ